MSQIQVRDEQGAAIARCNIRISHDQQSSDDAIFDVFTDLAGNTGWPIPFWPVKDYTLWVNDRNVLPEFGNTSVFVTGVSIHTGQNIEIVLPRVSEPPIDPPVPGDVPKGIVRSSGRMLLDDNGVKNFLTTTLMWANWGYREDRERLKENFAYCQSFKLDGIRSLGSVMGNSWEGRKTDPTWPDYEEIIRGQVQLAGSYGLRQFPFTMLGDHFTDVHKATDRMINALRGLEELLGSIEICNEWGHAVEIPLGDLMTIARKVRAAFPNTLLSLSRPQSGQADQMKALMREIGGPMIFPRHTERNENDRNWRQVRQAYDFVNDEPWSAYDQEGPGPASSVGELWKPRQMGMKRLLGAWAGCGAYCIHTGNGVRGKDDPANNRQPNLMDIQGFPDMVAALRMVERWMPEGVQNWKVVNNGRDTGPEPHHPLQLPDAVKDGFWEGNDDVEQGSVNKNYAVISPNGHDFMVGLFGLNDDNRAGQALFTMRVNAFDSLTGVQNFNGTVNKDQWLGLQGRTDREMSHVVVGARQ